MKKILAMFLAVSCLAQSVFAQDDEIRPAAIGISFIMNDYTTAQRIRNTSLSKVFRDKQWGKLSDMAPGAAISYFKGLHKYIDFAGTLAGSFTTDALNPDKGNSSDGFLLEVDAAANFKMVSEKYWTQPYIITGVGASMYKGSYFGAFLSPGLGWKVNFYDETHLFITSQYRIPVTKETSNYHFFNQIGFAQRVGEKKAPKVIAPPPPPPDTDKDGIIDSLDKCPTVPGLAKYNGCPIPDTDKDGINDEEDKCPTVPGVRENLGCPVIKEEVVKKINYAAQNIYFATGKYTLLAKSNKGLNDVAEILKAEPELKLAIDGHTDNTGKADKNQILSDNRADAVKKYLISKGVSEAQLTAAGHGQDQPVADNKTAAGRQKNRRVELKLSYY